jgi:hypothetical protein
VYRDDLAEYAHDPVKNTDDIAKHDEYLANFADVPV